MLLHFYQPPTQEEGITRQILNSCYLPLLRLLDQKSGFGLTLNLSGSLLFQLKQLEASEFFDLVKKLLTDQKIEIVNSAVYHPIIPLTPADVVSRQITKNQQLLEDLFGIKNIGGFFPPELAVDTDSLNLIDSHYIFVDQTSLDSKIPLTKFGQKYLLVNNRPVCDLLRSYPRELKAPMVVDLLQKNSPDNGLLVSANDAELFGHHYVERLQALSDLLDVKDIKFITASQAISQFGTKAAEVNGILPSTWQDCQKFSLWDKTDLQKEYLELLKLAHSLSDNDFLDQSYSSCYLYWLSNWPWWHPGLVEKGVANIINSAEGNKTVGTASQIFLDNMWQYHRSGEVEKKYQEYDKQLLNKW
jgi:alpha-amylase/alpha-mannosidase (GH57 family)